MEQFRVSRYNKPKTNNKRLIGINDCTLREGEQSGDVAFSMKDREMIAFALDEAGVDRIQIGFPEEDKQAKKEMKRIIGRLKNAGTETLIVAFSDQWKAQVDNALESGINHLNVIYRTSPYLMKLLGVDENQATERTLEVITYAKNQGAPKIVFTPTDATRSDWEFLKSISRKALAAGACELSVADTVGVATPDAIFYLVQGFKKEIGDVPIGLHAHNDFGLALANVFAAFEAGASMADTCINGMGDRAGNPALDEVVTAMVILYGYQTNVKMSKMWEISQMVGDIAKFIIPANKPVVGKNAFTEKLDIHVRAALKDPLAFQPFLPELVGNKTKIAIGKGSGPFALRAKLAELGLGDKWEDDMIKILLAEISRFAEENKRSLNDEDILKVIHKTTR